MKDRFQDYDEEKKNQAEKDKEEEEKKHDDKVKDANQANSDAGNEIKDIADRPSAAYAALLQEGFTDGKSKGIEGGIKLYQDCSRIFQVQSVRRRLTCEMTSIHWTTL